MSTNSDRSSTATAVEQTYTLSANLHARPAAQLARSAATFESDIRIEHDGREVDAASVLAVMSLGATSGTKVTVKAVGGDAEDAVAALLEVLAAAE